MESASQSLDHSGLLNLLTELDQTHIISEYNIRSIEEKDKFLEQVNNLEKIYPGGLKEYVKQAKILLLNSKNNVNPYANYTPSIPHGTNITVGDADYYKLESLGFNELQFTSFVLVAGGLGERLGYDDIKIGIPTELVTKRTFFELYSDYLKAYEARLIQELNITDEKWFIPFCIMTSDDTHDKTVQLLNAHNNFGLKEEQIEIVKQEKVPSILDNDCHFALAGNSLLIDTKPHGHGDIHTLLHQSGVAERWVNKGKKWVVFFQDTNALVFNSVPSAIGVSAFNNFVVNTITIPRKPGEAVGGICKLTDEVNGNSITLNVEYNQLDSLLRDKYNPQGDVTNSDGLSDFPGNTNVLVFELKTYFDTLNRTKGAIPEFVNPKYADDTKTVFKSATRLECMMQDFPKLLLGNEKVGFTMYPRWFCFSTCKNNLKEGIEKLKKNLIPETAFSVEQDIYNTNRILLGEILHKLEIAHSEGEIGDDVSRVDPFVEVLGTKVYFGPKIIIHPSFAVTLSELDKKIRRTIKITEDATLILEGNVEEDIYNAERSSRVNKNVYVALKEGEGENYEKIRGYTSFVLTVKNLK